MEETVNAGDGERMRRMSLVARGPRGVRAGWSPALALLAVGLTAALLAGCAGTGGAGWRVRDALVSSTTSTAAATSIDGASLTAGSVAATSGGAVTPASFASELTAWDPDAAPEYYRVVGPAELADVPAPGEVRYGGLDELGRTQGVIASVTHEMYEAARGHEARFTKADNPSGWGHNEEVEIAVPDGDSGTRSYHGAFWNRSHLLADSLGGAAARENVITGTRTQNVGANDGKGGMAYEETRVRAWLAEHIDGTVAYAATPVYVGDELVPRSVFVDVRTSDGTIDERVEVYNAALGYEINYHTGEFAPTK